MSRSALCFVGCVLGLAGACGGGGDDDPDTGNPVAGMSSSASGSGGGGPSMSGSGGSNGGSGSGGSAGTTPRAGMGGSGASGMGGSSASGTGGEPPDPPECATDEDIMTGMECAEEASGIFGIKTEIDVWWQDDVMPPIVDPGRGKIVIYLRANLTDVCPDGSGGQGEITVCGTELPGFISFINCDAYAITFPDTLWDLPTMPKIYTTGSTTGFVPGETLTIAAATGLLGVDMSDPMGAWPTMAGGLMCAAGTGGQCFPDHDGDGKPGISIVMGKIGDKVPNFETDGCGLAGDEPVVYRGAPLSAGPEALCNAPEDPNCRRAIDLAIGVRSRIGGAGEIGADCMSGAGDATADSVDSRVWDCTLDNGTPCAPAEAEFVDSAAPNYNILAKGAAPPTTVLRSACECPGGCLSLTGCPLDQTASKGPRSALVRLGNSDQTFDCAAVRAAPYPAFVD
jgi:hypothetical protein